jgi:threonine/homoserine/homoserine lactone efflux protein
VTSSFLAGVVAGYAIAIPVGAIAVLIVELGVRRGFRVAVAAGAGAATADGLYAALAAIGGVALGAAIEPYEAPLRLVAGAVLLAIAARGLATMLRGPRGTPGTTEGSRAAAATYLRFVGLTLLNPMTVIYFAALMLGLPEIGSGIPERGAFVVGALGASLSWQLLLAAVGAIAHRRLPARFQVGVSLTGNVVIAAFAVRIALGA